MRSPYLEMAGDAQFRMMSNNGLEYDASVMTGAYHDGGTWPTRGDQPLATCHNRNCPTFGKHPDIWEISINAMIRPQPHRAICAMADECGGNEPQSKQEILDFFWLNFIRHYLWNRAPVPQSCPLCMHAYTFLDIPDYLPALKDFLTGLGELDDVFVVSAAQILDWVQNPVPLEDIDKFKSWRRSCKRR